MSDTDPTAELIATIRLRTTGAAWMTDDDLTTMVGSVLCHGQPDLWAISAMVLEQYQINQLLDPNNNAVMIKSGDAAVTYQSSNSAALDQVIRRYWLRACPSNRDAWFTPRIRSFQVRPADRPQLFRRWIGVYPVLAEYWGSDGLFPAMGGFALGGELPPAEDGGAFAQQMRDDWAATLPERSDL